jgi:DNA-binding transcriptional regulator YhcF (GntR family)
MRYTTIIDIQQCPEIYRNVNARLLYLHMVLTCGYHDNDKGLVRKSVRQLAEETGITKSATEHALRQLSKMDLAKKIRGKLYVRTWIPEQPITKPKRKAQEIKEQAIAQEREAKDREREMEAQRSKESAVSYEEYKALKNAGKI